MNILTHIACYIYTYIYIHINVIYVCILISTTLVFPGAILGSFIHMDYPHCCSLVSWRMVPLLAKDYLLERNIRVLCASDHNT